MKQALLSAAILLAGFGAQAQTGNYGIGASTPSTKLDVAGAITNRQGTDVAVSGTAVTMGANLTNSQYRLTGTPTSTFTITGPTTGSTGSLPLQAGARMVLVNATNYDGILNGFTVGSTNAVEFVYSNNGAIGWVATNGAGQKTTAFSTGCPMLLTLPRYTYDIPAATFVSGDAAENTYTTTDIPGATMTSLLANLPNGGLILLNPLTKSFTTSSTFDMSLPTPSASMVGKTWYFAWDVSLANNFTFSTIGSAYFVPNAGVSVVATNSGGVRFYDPGVSQSFFNPIQTGPLCLVQFSGVGGANSIASGVLEVTALSTTNWSVNMISRCTIYR